MVTFVPANQKVKGAMLATGFLSSKCFCLRGIEQSRRLKIKNRKTTHLKRLMIRGCEFESLYLLETT